MFRVLAIISLICIFILLEVSSHINAADTETSTRKNDDVVFRIVNGKPANLGSIPYQVSLKAPKSGQYMSFCGGTVVAENKILTAAHCLTRDGNVCQKLCKKYKMKSLMKLYAVAGTLRNLAGYQSDDQGTEQWRRMTSVRIPRGYWFPKNDICIAFAAPNFIFNDYVKAIPLASITQDYGARDCIASGWGLINDRQFSSVLLWAYLRLIPHSTCSLIHRQSMTKFICTESEHTEILQGDSGGPLVCHNTGDPNDVGQGVVVGVVSGYARGGGSKRNSFFTRVSSHLAFLNSHGVPTRIAAPAFRVVLLSHIISNFNYVLFYFTKTITT